VIEMMEGFIDMWQAAHLSHDVNGWRVWYVAPIYAMTKPEIHIGRNLLVFANFKRKLRAGQFCKTPHKLIDFVNSYERKDK
jgi:hypothetical protein